MITVTNDITKLQSGIICHQVNCQNRIGAGVSKAICEKYPEVKRQYHIVAKKIKSPEERFGLIHKVPVSENVTVYNIFAQLNYGNANKTKKCYTDEEKLTNAIIKICEENKGTWVCIPEKIGCGLAGGNWDSVLNKIKHLSNLCVVQFS